MPDWDYSACFPGPSNGTLALKCSVHFYICTHVLIACLGYCFVYDWLGYDEEPDVVASRQRLSVSNGHASRGRLSVSNGHASTSLRI